MCSLFLRGDLVQDLIQEIAKFSDDRVWRTKKTRMESEARLKQNHRRSNYLINYYTFAVLAFSIWSLIFEPESTVAKYFTLMTIITSLGLFVLTLTISTLGFKEKALQFKECYLRLDALEYDFKHLIRCADELDKETVKKRFYLLQKKYNEILTLTDNHEQSDSEKIIIDRKIAGYEQIEKKYNTRKKIIFYSVLLLFLIPILLATILVIIMKSSV